MDVEPSSSRTPAVIRHDPLPAHPAPSAAPWGRAAAVAFTLLLAGIATQTGWVGLAAGFALACLPVPLYVSLALWIDRFEPEPPRLLARAFVWGAAAASGMAMILNTAAAPWSGTGWAGPVLVAPLVEELSKGCALLLLYHREHPELDNRTDGVIYAAMVGLGFAMTENVLYYGMAVQEGSASLTFALRGAVFPFAHPLFTAIFGIGLGVARETGRPRLRRLAPAAGLAGAVLLHALWNASAEMERGFWGVYLGLMVPAFVAALLVVRGSLRREARVLREQLAPLAAAGLLREEELLELCCFRTRVRREWHALRRGGRAGLLACLRHHQAVGDLAFRRWRLAHGRARGHDHDPRRGELLVERVRATGYQVAGDR